MLQKAPTKGQSSANHPPEPGLIGAPKALTSPASTHRLDLTSQMCYVFNNGITSDHSAEPQLLFLFPLSSCGTIHSKKNHFMIGTRVLTSQS